MPSASAPNRCHRIFADHYRDVIDRFFSRKAEYWPVFANEDFQEVLKWRFQGETPEQMLHRYPRGKALTTNLHSNGSIPAGWEKDKSAQSMKEMARFCAIFSKNWEHPSSAENVITTPCDPALYGSMLASLANPNLAYQEYAGLAADLEKKVVRQMASLIGYDPRRATGIFTQGGTFANLYGYLLGIRKSLKEAREHGMGYTGDYRFINSLGGHYSNITNLSLLGVNIRDKTIRIKLGPNNDIDQQDFERQLEACLRLKCVVPTIMLTMGTTDTFGVDEVKPIRDIRDRLSKYYGLEVLPHIHVDAAVGWAMLFFNDYDCQRNELAINACTLTGIRKHQKRFAQMKYADSCSIDFQKWGYAPYTSSLVMIRNGSDLLPLHHDPELFSYFDRNAQGYTHLQCTIECSRGATGLFGAYAALQAMGVRGYQVVIAHCLQNANYFRACLNKLGFVKVVAEDNQGPSVGYRIYDPALVTSADDEYAFECLYQDTPAYHKRVRRNTAFHRRAFKQKGKVGLFTNWIEAVAHTDYSAQGSFEFLAGEKAVFFNPRTTYQEIDVFVEALRKTVVSARRRQPARKS